MKLGKKALAIIIVILLFTIFPALADIAIFGVVVFFLLLATWLGL